MEVGDSNNNRGNKARRMWSRNEEDALLTILEKAVVRGQRCDTGAFKLGTSTMIERRLSKMCPQSGLRATPHIESKMKKLKKQYSIIYDMLNKSGFRWNDSFKCVEVDSDKAWNSYVQSNPNAKGWRDKSFPMYDRLAIIFGNDRATGIEAQTPIEMVDDIIMDGQNEEINDISSPMSVNQNIHGEPFTQSQLKRTRKSRLKDDNIANRFGDVADRLFNKMSEKFDKSEANYPKYLAEELKKLGFSFEDNLDISKAMRSDPSNVEVFKIIEIDVDKIRFATRFLNN